MNIVNDIIEVPFYKMSAAGNDFILIDEIYLSEYKFDYPRLAKSICNRRLGIGADGMLVYKSHMEAGFEMDYYNSDGSTGGMCGNGARCISAYHFDVYGKDENSVSFFAFNNKYTATLNDIAITVRMKDPSHILTDLTINIDGKNLRCNFIDTGAPHVVLFFEDLNEFFPDSDFDKIDITYVGSRIRYHEAFKPLGTNVNIVNKINDGTLNIRTYERGVEAETLSCGTGAIASALISATLFNQSSPINVLTRGGETLVIGFNINPKKKLPDISDVTLKGSWKYHCAGLVYVDKKQYHTGINHLNKNAFKDINLLTLQKDR